MAQDPDEIVDLEAFHQELLNSVNNVRRMVVSWLPPSAELEGFKNFDDTNVNLESLRTRPERLGLGAKPSSLKTSAQALANPNSAEGRMLKTLLNGNSRKRKASEEPEVPRASTSSLSKHTAQTTINGPANQASDSDEEEDSRSKSISAKNKKKSDLFHNKPVKSRQNNASSATEPMPKKSKQQKESTATTGSGNTKEATPDTFAKPTIPTGSKKGNTSAPASPVRSTIGTTAKPALSPPFQAQLQNGRPREIDNSDDEDDASILTETTMTGTLMGSPQADDSEQRKKKRKKKKKKNRISQPPVEGGPQPNGSANTGMLFGNSILD